MYVVGGQAKGQAAGVEKLGEGWLTGCERGTGWGTATDTAHAAHREPQKAAGEPERIGRGRAWGTGSSWHGGRCEAVRGRRRCAHAPQGWRGVRSSARGTQATQSRHRATQATAGRRYLLI